MKKLILLSVATLALISCEKETKTVEETVETTAPTIETPTVETPTADTTDVEAGEAVLEIGGTDAMQFTKNELRVPAGSKVTLTLVHEGEQPKEAMGHNWVLLKQGTNIQDFAMEAMNAKDNEYIPADTDAVIAHTKVIGGGETVTITFDAPEKGTYDFICSFPGHFGTMQGKFIVE